jgi:hypothetical protein
VVIAIPGVDGGLVAPGTFEVEGPSDAGPGLAQIVYLNFSIDAGSLFGEGGSVTVTQGGDGTIAGTFSTTVAGTSLSGSFSTPVCNPYGPSNGSGSL